MSDRESALSGCAQAALGGNLRTSSGADTFTFKSQYETVGGLFPRCTHTFAWRSTGTLTFSSV